MPMIDSEDYPTAEDGAIIPYYMTNEDQEPWCYNDITVWGQGYAQVQAQAEHKDDPFQVSLDHSIDPR